ncbi:RICIN domain-containing protein [Streptomyces sp. NPDC051907]|uniref:RICIN domain-containing protein n=1 Tax=Streptomyces sp. NPDC051907 TaxID=3155284 RepID=UPI00342571F9
MNRPALPHPDPAQARNPAEFVALLRKLRSSSGLTYRDLERRAADAGEVLPRSTVATALRHDVLPRPELLKAFLAACGYDGSVDAWVAARDRIASKARERSRPGESDGAPEPGDGREADGASDAVGPYEDPEAQKTTRTGGAARAPEATGPAMAPVRVGSPLPPEPSPASAPHASGVGSGRGGIPALRRAGALAAALLAVCAIALVGRAAYSDSGDEEPAATSSSAPKPTTPAGPVEPGTYHIRATGSGLCLSESTTEDSGGRVAQFDCQSSVPTYLMEPVGGDQYMIRSLHPVMGHGCLGVDAGLRSDGARLMNDYCGRRGTAERFRIGPARSGDRMYRIRPVHTGACVTIPGSIATTGAPVVQLPCSEAETGQVFAFDPIPAPTGIPDITTN